jgi:hypothetical protein
MWNNKPKVDKNSGSIIKSGHDVTKIVGLARIKSDFASALELTSTDATEATILEYAEKGGQFRGFNTLLARASKMKLNTAKAALKTNQIVFNHANVAAKTELGYQKATAKNLETMSETLLDLGIEQSQHAGFASYNAKADSLISF